MKQKKQKTSLEQRIVTSLISDLTDRSGLGDSFEECDKDIQNEIIETWEGIIKEQVIEFLLDR